MISVKQNEEKQIRCLAAQRQLYSIAKKVFAAQILLGGPIAVATAILGIAFPVAIGYVALWGILVALTDVLWLSPWQKRLRGSAARVQEAFDCAVLSLPWNEFKAGKRPDPEFVKEQADKYQRWAAKMPPLANWYSQFVDDIPLHIGRVACQRSNCLWDSKQRRRYATWVVGILGSVVVIISLLALRERLTVEDLVLKVAAPLLPALLLGIRQFKDQTAAASRLDRLKEHSEELWGDALDGMAEAEVSVKARNLQDEILESRCEGPPVFDWVYGRLQRDYEGQMNYGVAELVDEARHRLGLPPQT